MLPAVCKWNAKQGANNERQELCKKVLVDDKVVKELVQKKFGEKKDYDLGDVLDVIFRELGMPRTLKEVNVGRDQMDGLALNTLKDMWSKTNAKPIEQKEQVLEILEMVVD
jgi:alcohol dehydrogenase class IV